MWLSNGEVHVLEHWVDGETFADQQVFDVTPALARRQRVDVLQKKVLTLPRARLRQYVQSYCGSANLVEPCSQGEKRFVVAISKAMHSIGNVLIREDWIVPRTKFKCQEFVIRARIRTIFKSIRHIQQAHSRSA